MKIGIVTIYYNNFNYGGCLQAYALQKECEKIGVDAEIINYYDNSRFRRFLSNTKTFLKMLGKPNLKKRIKRINKFRKAIKHSKLYYMNNLDKAGFCYDKYIVGSDQVWNPNYINKFYSLQFVDDKKIKIAYAASVGKDHLSNEQVEFYHSFLTSFYRISVREYQTIPLIKKEPNIMPVVTLDPTLLLDKDEWDLICSKRLIPDDYLFCYFLNDNIQQREIAKEFAKKHKLKLVTIPHLGYIYRKCDIDFGDCQLYSIGPSDFISLIKYASFIITDSFHATVFSHIYHKQFLAFDDQKTRTGSRITTLTKMFKTEDRYINNIKDINLEYISSLKDIDYSKESSDYRQMKSFSIDFLKLTLVGIEK